MWLLQLWRLQLWRLNFNLKMLLNIVLCINIVFSSTIESENQKIAIKKNAYERLTKIEKSMNNYLSRNQEFNELY